VIVAKQEKIVNFPICSIFILKLQCRRERGVGLGGPIYLFTWITVFKAVLEATFFLLPWEFESYD